jgi:molybdenum cofactor synthesis domain-containing protein
MHEQANPTAAILVIGDEILSGRTKDTNINTIARFLGERGIDLNEVRIVHDDMDAIAEALNALRARNDYVFTTGGIGPTHDDITADAVAKAFGVSIDYHPEAVKLLRDYFAAMHRKETPARMRMARIPQGAELIPNPLTKAPGFHIGNVFVMAGVPKIMEAMLHEVDGKLRRGSPVKSVTIRAELPEGDLGDPLRELAARHKGVTIGSYPFNENGHFGTRIVIRSRDAQALDSARADVRALVDEYEAKIPNPPVTWE